MHTPTRWGQVAGSAAARYQRELVPAMFAPWAPVLADLAGLRPGDRVLDVACGTGVVARLAAERAGIAGLVVGLDLNGGMLAVARTLPPVAGAPTAWCRSDALALPLAAATFDAVLCQQGLQQFPDRIAALREMRRVLAAPGRLAVGVWGRIEGSPGMAALATALERHVGAAAGANRRAPFALADAAELHRLIAAAGFRNITVRTVVEIARFSSAEAFAEAQIAATPLATLGTLTDQTRALVVSEVRAALRPYAHDQGLALPMEAHLALAHTG
jgi:ubiquinone/menaquinone biosynthesis C-methylase UbiE